MEIWEICGLQSILNSVLKFKHDILDWTRDEPILLTYLTHTLSESILVIIQCLLYLIQIGDKFN